MEAPGQPVFNLAYNNPHGEKFFVIGIGTQGIVIEYHDGRVEIVPQHTWHSLVQTSTAH